MWISNSFLTLLLNISGKFWFPIVRYWEYLAILSSQIWDLYLADVFSCVNSVELCVGYDDAETQRIVWDQAKRCCLLLTMGQIWTHVSKGSKVSTLASPGKYRFQNNKLFSKENSHFCISSHYYMSLLPFKSGKMLNVSTLQNSECKLYLQTEENMS